MSVEAASSDLGMCAWCDQPAVTHVITRKGRKNRKVAPVCELHAADFESRGQLTVRVEVDQKLQRDLQKSQWKASQRPWSR